MHSLRDIRRRIRSVGTTSQVTRAMQMVAASKMRKAQSAALAGRPFAQLLYRIQREATSRSEELQLPLLEVRPIKKRAVILVGPDRGLCGALNSNLLRLTVQYDPASTVFVAAGRRAAQFVARTGRHLAAEFQYGDSPTFADARAIAAFARDLFLNREVDEIEVVFTRFVNTLTQEPRSVDFLPVGVVKLPGVEPEEVVKADDAECLFEPDAEGVLGYLLPHYLNLFIYFVLLDAKASEQSARMVAMKNATDSAQRLIKDLTLEYNKLRQGIITREILEIAGGQAD